MHIIGCLSVLLLFAGVLVFSLVKNFLRLFFGKDTFGPFSRSRSHAAPGGQREEPDRSSSVSRPAPKKKIIGKDEGEYVDFEEIE